MAFRLILRSLPNPNRVFCPVACSGIAQIRLMSTTYRKALPSFSMEGKVCLVTGGAQGIGKEICHAFVQSGCTSLAIVDLKVKEAQDAANALIAESCVGGNMKPEDFNIIALECDVASERSVQKTYQQVMDTFGRVDSVVACAGIVENYSAIDYPTDRMKRMYDINVHGAFYTAREAARNMIPRGGGSIVLIASISADVVMTPQLQTPYHASKAAVKQMASSLAVEWAKKGVRVNALSPGYILTDLTKGVMANDTRAADMKKIWESLTPMGRMAEPKELSGATIFLASDASEFVTGAELRVDGGYTLL